MKHPKALYALSAVELWERYAYYLMLAIFTLYLNEHMGRSEGEAASLYGTFIGLVYLSPLFGGYLADKKLGYRRSVLIGAFLMGIGYMTLYYDTELALQLAMALVIVGNGLFKPNISTLVGNLYPVGDSRKDAAFSIFYVCINVGAFFSPLVGGYMRTHYSWGAAFASAGVGMFIGLGIFAYFSKWVEEAEERANIPQPNAVLVTKEVKRSRVKTLAYMCLIVMFFWIGFHQNGSTLTFWMRDNTDRTLGGLLAQPFNPEYGAMINSFFVVFLTPMLMGVFSLLRKRGLEPSTPSKIGYGMLLTGISFLVMAVAGLVGGNTGQVSILWIISGYFVVTLGELCLSPMGLSMVTKLAPRDQASLMMGLWFLATAIGNKFAGQVGVWWPEWKHSNFFLFLAALSFVAAILVFIRLPSLKKVIPEEIENTAQDTLLPPQIGILPAPGIRLPGERETALQ